MTKRLNKGEKVVGKDGEESKWYGHCMEATASCATAQPFTVHSQEGPFNCQLYIAQ